ncbi:pyrimidine-nucleoside phosphorylase [Mangrovibacillus cuniculi]|uniref:Pyrimidine-nucleoside phosphorylase n=1 Tax=Mangrovibacillus cuniculi TaxID=2593652 RepID=A0A7S8HFT0_9BACI|nr:pyrimidine-nucleoside phosphorylase [Mangrovibacillus cuniculi]QPC46760.1 pyrimidine-nucleoside phosphorylase [Mangrovibacillus cuniculi]
MRMVDIIQAKRNGKTLTKEEINFFVEGYTNGTIPDYQASALLMAVYFKGMSAEETATLTEAMVASGETIDLSGIEGPKVDKHSTGGVGDKVTFIVGPLVASAGVPVAKMSGRGLGHTGGTLDKLEAIDGLEIEMSIDKFIEQVNKTKLAVAGQTGNLAPADKKLYALRDVTATVDSIPLIAGSIMSKKLASGANSIVLDVKTGSGAFMKSLEDSEALATEMVNIGKHLGRNTIAVISDMNQPLGYEIGNANEIKEAVEILQGKDVTDLRVISLTIAAHMIVLAGKYDTFDEAYKALEGNIENGSAFEMLRQMVIAQGGDVNQVDDLTKLPQASNTIEVKAPSAGFVTAIDAESVGIAAMYLGAGRATKEDDIDHSVGITLLKKVGDEVAEGETFAYLLSNTETAEDAEKKLLSAYTFGTEKPEERPLIHKIIK